VRIALGLEFAGTSYRGWQSQPDGRGVQDVLERAVTAIAGERIGTIACGRTDAGVHATLQIVHFDTAAIRPDSAWVRGVNSHLPNDVAVQWASAVAIEFHARYSASARHYSYLLLNRPVRPALAAGRVGWYHRTLDIDAMREAATMLVGTHDFSAFRAAECQARSPVKTMTRIAVERVQDTLRFDFSASAFLHHMVRNIIGALIHIGAGKAPPQWMAQLLHQRDRTLGPATFAPDGLYLTGADYDARWNLPPTRRRLQWPLSFDSAACDSSMRIAQL
jgi:tRNA pseudouridine38-40 synthase